MDHFTVKVTVKCFDQVDNLLRYTIMMEYRPRALTMDAIESLFIDYEFENYTVACRSTHCSTIFLRVKIWSLQDRLLRKPACSALSN